MSDELALKMLAGEQDSGWQVEVLNDPLANPNNVYHELICTNLEDPEEVWVVSINKRTGAQHRTRIVA